jgi:Uncharacterised nucleotidyltransferase
LEWKLLLATTVHPAQTETARIRSLVTAPQGKPEIDWQSLLDLAAFHGEASLLYQNLTPVSDAVPAAILESLRRLYQTNVQKSLVLARELARVLDFAAALGVELIPYKGIVLSEAYYGDLALRQAGDIDLFIRRRDVVRIKNAIRDLGYVPRINIPPAAEQRYIASGYEYSFDSSAGKNLMELQWALQPRYYAVDYDMDALFTRAVEVAVAGRRVKTPAPEDLLLILSLHTAKHVWERLIWLCDIAQILRHDLNWNAVLSRAQELRITRILHVTLLLTNRFLGTAIPAAPDAAIGADRAAHAFAKQISTSIIAGVSWEEQKIAYFRLMMGLREYPADRLRFLTRLAFTPGPGEWESLALPRALSPFYRAVRLVRLAGRLSRSVVGCD